MFDTSLVYSLQYELKMPHWCSGRISIGFDARVGYVSMRHLTEPAPYTGQILSPAGAHSVSKNFLEISLKVPSKYQQICISPRISPPCPTKFFFLGGGLQPQQLNGIFTQNYLPPKFIFSAGFGHFILKIRKTRNYFAKILKKKQNFLLKLEGIIPSTM